ncbi:MAG: sigma-70 family RNA polymerase sigma factor [Planctomycetota bacterium]|nr:sigma-70 family RNA polymerase sigma factor [Planctomycetota bacterium]MDA1178826.1 sigma-70 family RNA polymerase sigma factor [Planctomycetota bacterium]
MKIATPLVPTTDEHLIGQAAGGDFTAYQELVTRFQVRVFGVAFRIVGQRQDAEDVTQQTFLSLIEHIDSFRGESSVATWLLRIATNHALKLLRKRRGLPTVSLSGPTDDDDNYSSLPHPDFIARWSATPETLAQRAEVREQIGSALNTLDDKYRVVFVLRDIEGMSVRETAEALDLTEGTVKVRLLRARLMLREQLTRQFGDEATRLFPDHEHG